MSLAQIERVMLLQAVHPFKHCAAEEVVRISAIAEEMEFSADQQIYGLSDPAKALFCTVGGVVRLADEQGAERTVNKGQSFGVREILSGQLRGESAFALEPTRTLAIDGEHFFDLLSNNIEIVKALFREILSDDPEGIL